ncbi:MAG: oligosaccharyl transferase, archaeosortase A system-associated, partial [Methanoregulaceae archaeon]|nr:oligosaccharyl transferase, archaeosortase A system-associated [Methanoregulaceae archaeon]
TIFLFIIEFFHKKPAEYLVLVNTVIFGIAAIVSLFFAFTSGGFGLTGYTYTHPISYLLVIFGTLILYFLSNYLKGKNPFLYPAAILVLILVTLLAMLLIAPGLYSTFIDGFITFFGLNPYAATVQEARPWTLAEAWQTFNFGLLL